MPNFTIPFEVDSDGSANHIREVELLVSQDRGKRWQSVARQSVETKKFTFRADTDGEYWFAFRTTTTNGTVNPMTGQPMLRVSVDTKSKAPMIVLPAQSSESGPLTPPRPMRFQDEHSSKPLQPVKTKESEAEPSGTSIEEPTMEEMLGPWLPGFDPSEWEKNRAGTLVDDLLSGMTPFLDVLPMPTSAAPRQQTTADQPGTLPSNVVFKPSVAAGNITDVVLSSTTTKPQIIVRWNTGKEVWHDAQIDVLRSSTKEGARVPIAINLPNSGEYWWFLMPEDLKPFYITVRIRSFNGGIREDITLSPITIDPKLPLLQSQRP